RLEDALACVSGELVHDVGRGAVEGVGRGARAVLVGEAGTAGIRVPSEVPAAHLYPWAGGERASAVAGLGCGDCREPAAPEEADHAGAGLQRRRRADEERPL